MVKKIAVIYIVFILLIVTSLGVLLYKDNQYKDNYIENLKEEYNINEDNGDRLVQCENGSIEAYKPLEVQVKICGESINKNT